MHGAHSPFPFVFWRQPASGNEPVREWLQDLDKEDRREMGFAMSTLQIGWPLGMPLCRPVGDGLHELRERTAGRSIVVLRARRNDCRTPRLLQDDAEDAEG